MVIPAPSPATSWYVTTIIQLDILNWIFILVSLSDEALKGYQYSFCKDIIILFNFS